MRTTPTETLQRQLTQTIEIASRLKADLRRMARGTAPIRIGDRCSFPELVAEVERLLSERPMTHADLKEATGANPNRLKGAVTQLLRNGVPVVNLSDDPRRALWYVKGGAA